MPTYLIVYSAAVAAPLDAFLQPPSLMIAGLQVPLDWGTVTLEVPPGEHVATVWVDTRFGRQQQSMRLSIPQGSGTRLSFAPAQPAGLPPAIRFEGQWPADAAMSYYAARDARTLTPVPGSRPVGGPVGATAASSAPQVPAVGPHPGSSAEVPAQRQMSAPGSFGQQQGSVVEPSRQPMVSQVPPQFRAHSPQPAPVQPVQPPRFAPPRPAPQHGVVQQSSIANAYAPGPAAATPPVFPQQRVEVDVYGRGHLAGDKRAAAVPTPAEFDQYSRTVRATEHAKPGWYSDPSGRSELRWFDGARWTEHVSRAGVGGVDPL